MSTIVYSGESSKDATNAFFADLETHLLPCLLSELLETKTKNAIRAFLKGRVESASLPETVRNSAGVATTWRRWAGLDELKYTLQYIDGTTILLTRK